MKNAINIKKEEIFKLEFKSKKLLPKKLNQVGLNLRSAIDASLKINKVKIYFNTTRGLFSTTAKVLMMGKKFVVLKGNIMIPIKCIVKVGV